MFIKGKNWKDLLQKECRRSCRCGLAGTRQNCPWCPLRGLWWDTKSCSGQDRSPCHCSVDGFQSLAKTQPCGYWGRNLEGLLQTWCRQRKMWGSPRKRLKGRNREEGKLEASPIDDRETILNAKMWRRCTIMRQELYSAIPKSREQDNIFQNSKDCISRAKNRNPRKTTKT